MVRAKKVEKEPIYLEWVRCSEKTEDPYWKKKFKDFSDGKFPKNCVYNSGILTFWNNKRSDEIQLTISDTSTMISDSIVFFETNCSLQSNVAKRHKREVHSINNWAKCNEISKTILINNYVSILKDIYQLSPESVRQLRATIHMGMICKVISVGEVKNSEIVSMDGLEWSKKRSKFYYGRSENINLSQYVYSIQHQKTPPAKEKLTPYESKWIKSCKKKGA